MTAETLTTLLSRLRNHLGDLNPASYQFSDAQLTQWLNAAIRDVLDPLPAQEEHPGGADARYTLLRAAVGLPQRADCAVFEASTPA